MLSTTIATPAVTTMRVGSGGRMRRIAPNAPSTAPPTTRIAAPTAGSISNVIVSMALGDRLVRMSRRFTTLARIANAPSIAPDTSPATAPRDMAVGTVGSGSRVLGRAATTPVRTPTIAIITVLSDSTSASTSRRATVSTKPMVTTKIIAPPAIAPMRTAAIRLSRVTTPSSRGCRSVG
jgi:hypothetical protein